MQPILCPSHSRQIGIAVACAKKKEANLYLTRMQEEDEEGLPCLADGGALLQTS